MDTLCWKCSKSMGFFQNPCPYCGATNGNVDIDKAMEEMKAESPGYYAVLEGKQ